MMYEVFVETHFSAAHRLANYPGNCARWHGHNWAVTVFIQSETLSELGLAVDFREVKRGLRAVLERFDHGTLNDIPELAETNPTCEVIARHIYRQLTAELASDDVRVARVKVSETPGTGVSYFE